MESNDQVKGLMLVKQWWPFLASLGGATVMILAFFIPSIQDQWDRYQSRKVIEEFVTLGDQLFDESRYAMAEEAFAKAFELSEFKRLDVEVKRLNARVNRVHDSPDWGSEIPDGLKEIDFQFLLHFQVKKGEEQHRVNTLNCYGIFLARAGRINDAKKTFEHAVQLMPNEAITYINMGNLLDQEEKRSDAEKMYRKAIELEPNNAYAHYDLGLLLEIMGNQPEADMERARAVKIDSTFRDQ
jgi:tetratricopeptide (TPR) repeat protein